MRRKLRTLLLTLVAFLLLIYFVFIALTTSRAPPLAPLPNPNGYDDFVKAGNLIIGFTNTPYAMEPDELRTFVAINAEALRLARVGLNRTCSVPTVEGLTNFNMSDLATIKKLAHLLAGDGRVAELDGRTYDAVLCHLDDIRLGNEVSRGGFVIHRLVGMACEAIGYARLAKIVPSLKPEEARAVIAELEKLDQSAVTWPEVMKLENAFMRHQMPKHFNPIAWVHDWWVNRFAIKSAKQRSQKTDAHIRLIATELALRCYQSEQGRLPTRLDELVPKYLTHTPSDPFSSQPMIYRAQATNWLLYSVGPDGVDDGGKPIGRGTSGAVMPGDLFYDSP